MAPTGLPLIRRRCPDCPSDRFRAHGKFRVNANHKLLDVWLLALCVGCGGTVKLTVLERAPVRTIDPGALNRFHGNDPALAAELLAGPGLLHRNGIALDWEGAWTLRTGAARLPDAGTVEVSVRFAQRIPVRTAKLLSAGLNTPRAAVERLIADGRITSASRLGGSSAADFGFTLRR